MYNLPLVTLFYLIKISACETSLDFEWSHEMGCQIKYVHIHLLKFNFMERISMCLCTAIFTFLKFGISFSI